MNQNVSPGAEQAVEESLEEALASLPPDARILAAQSLKAARVASQGQHGFLGALVNMEVIETEDGRSVLAMDVTPNALNGAGYVHGGMLFTLADYAMGATAHRLAGPDCGTVTLEAKANYVSNIKEGRIIARCEALYQTKRLITLETRIHRADTDELIMIVTGTFYIIRKGEDNDS